MSKIYKIEYNNNISKRGVVMGFDEIVADLNSLEDYKKTCEMLDRVSEKTGEQLHKIKVIIDGKG